MSSKSFRVGSATVALSVDDSTSIPSCASLTFTASAATPTDLLLNDINTALPTSTNMQVIVGLVGRDSTNGGYTVSRTSVSSGNLTVTSGQGILVTVVNANWPANFDKAICAAIFLKIGSSDFYLADLAYIDTSTDFKHMIMARPVQGAQQFTSALLQSTTTDTVLGDRAGLGVTYRNLTPKTSEGLTITRNTSTVNISPDTGPDFTLTTARSVTLSFQLLANDLRDIVAGNSGLYSQYSSGGLNIKESQMSLQTASAKVTGNRPIKVVLPPDNQGIQETRLYLGQLTQNQEGNTETWGRDAFAAIGYTFSAVPTDALLDNVHTEISYRSST